MGQRVGQRGACPGERGAVAFPCEGGLEIREGDSVSEDPLGRCAPEIPESFTRQGGDADLSGRNGVKIGLGAGDEGGPS